MKKYQKAQMIAKNLPTGSYAAGCPEHYNGFNNSPGQQAQCRKCERTV